MTKDTSGPAFPTQESRHPDGTLSQEALSQPEQEPAKWEPSDEWLDIAVHAAMAQQKQEQEPVCPDCTAKVLYECVFCSSNNYPPKEQPEREWVGLTVDEYHTIRNSTWEVSEAIRFTAAKLKEKNT